MHCPMHSSSTITNSYSSLTVQVETRKRFIQFERVSKRDRSLVSHVITWTHSNTIAVCHWWICFSGSRNDYLLSLERSIFMIFDAIVTHFSIGRAILIWTHGQDSRRYRSTFLVQMISAETQPPHPWSHNPSLHHMTHSHIPWREFGVSQWCVNARISLVHLLTCFFDSFFSHQTHCWLIVNVIL